MWGGGGGGEGVCKFELCRHKDRGPIVGHFDADLMRTYQKQYGGRFVCHLVYHQVEESWYRELSQMCHSVSA